MWYPSQKSLQGTVAIASSLSATSSWPNPGAKEISSTQALDQSSMASSVTALSESPSY